MKSLYVKMRYAVVLALGAFVVCLSHAAEQLPAAKAWVWDFSGGTELKTNTVASANQAHVFAALPFLTEKFIGVFSSAGNGLVLFVR